MMYSVKISGNKDVRKNELTRLIKHRPVEQSTYALKSIEHMVFEAGGMCSQNISG